MRRKFQAFTHACAVGALTLGALCAAHGRPANTDVLAVLPFTMANGHIFVATYVNGKAATFVVDTGSGVDILDTGSASRLGVAASSTSGRAVVTGTGGSVRADPATIAMMQVGNLQIPKTPVYLLNVAHSVQCDGLLGYEFLRRFVVTFDFRSNLITLRRPGAAPPGQWTIPFAISGGIPNVVGEAGGWTGRFIIDTGCSGTVVLNAPFVEKYHLRDRFARDGRRVKGRGIGGSTQGDFVQLDSFQLGRIAIDGVMVELSSQTQGAFVDAKVAGTVGTEVLSRYTLTMDYPGSRIILTANGVRP